MILSLTLILAGGVTVTLPERVEVTGTEISVGAVAQVTGDDAELVERVRSASLGYAPAPGYSRLLVRERLAAELRQKLAGVEIALDGAAECRVSPRVETVTAARLLESARSALEELLAGSDAEVAPAGGAGDVLVPAPGESLVLRAVPRESGGRSGAWSVPVEIVVDGGVHRTVWTRWTVRTWEAQHVLRRAVAAGETLTPADFVTRRVEAGPGSRDALAPHEVAHAEARRALAAGSVVTAADVERATLVRRGDPVSLEVRRGSVSVRAIAYARQDGRAGDRILVVCERTGKELSAVVRTRELVELRIR